MGTKFRDLSRSCSLERCATSSSATRSKVMFPCRFVRSSWCSADMLAEASSCSASTMPGSFISSEVSSRHQYRTFCSATCKFGLNQPHKAREPVRLGDASALSQRQPRASPLRLQACSTLQNPKSGHHKVPCRSNLPPVLSDQASCVHHRSRLVPSAAWP